MVGRALGSLRRDPSLLAFRCSRGCLACHSGRSAAALLSPDALGGFAASGPGRVRWGYLGVRRSRAGPRRTRLRTLAAASDGTAPPSWLVGSEPPVSWDGPVGVGRAVELRATVRASPGVGGTLGGIWSGSFGRTRGHGSIGRRSRTSSRRPAWGDSPLARRTMDEGVSGAP